MAWGRARRAAWGEGGLAGLGIDAALRASRAVAPPIGPAAAPAPIWLDQLAIID